MNTTFEQAVDEVIADSCEMMLKDSKVLSDLYRKNATLYERVKDFIADSLARMQKAFEGASPSHLESEIMMRRAAEQLQQMWDAALADAVQTAAEIKNTATGDGGLLSIDFYDYGNIDEYKKPITIQDIKALQSITRKSINQFTSEDFIIAQKWAYKFQQELGIKSPFFRAWFGEWRAFQTSNTDNKVTIADIPAYVDTNEARKENRGSYKNNDTGWMIRVSREGETNTISHSGEGRLSEYGLAGIESLLENAYLFNTEVHEHHKNNPKNDMIAFDHKLYSLGKDVNGNIGLYRLTVEEYFQSKSEPSNKKFHNLKHIEKVAELSADALSGKTSSGGSTNNNSTTIFTISDLYGFVNKVCVK